MDLIIIEAGAFYLMDRTYLDVERIYALDQATSANQALLRHLGARRAHPNLDCFHQLPRD